MELIESYQLALDSGNEDKIKMALDDLASSGIDKASADIIIEEFNKNIGGGIFLK